MPYSVTKFLRENWDSFKVLETQYLSNWNPTENVGSYDFDYEDILFDNELHSFNGVLNERIIRRHLCTLFNKNVATDSYCQSYLSGDNKDEELQTSYEIYKDLVNYKLEDIMDHIKVVAKAPFHFHGEREKIQAVMSINYKFGNMLDFLDTLSKKFQKMDYDRSLDLPLEKVHLTGSVDYIFDDTVFCQISTSMFESSFKKKTSQVFFYILFHYIHNYYQDKISKNFTIMIYNPLLGKLHTNDINVTPEMCGLYVQQMEIVGGKMQPITSHD